MIVSYRLMRNFKIKKIVTDSIQKIMLLTVRRFTNESSKINSKVHCNLCSDQDISTP